MRHALAAIVVALVGTAMAAQAASGLAAPPPALGGSVPTLDALVSLPAVPTPAPIPAPTPALPEVGPAADPAFTGPADIVGHAAQALESGPLAPDQLGLLAAEQQLRAQVAPSHDTGWRLLRFPFDLPELPSAALLIEPREALVAAPTSAAVTAVGFASLLAMLVPRLPVLPLYSRIEREEAMLNGRRHQLYEIVRAEPGIHLSDLVRRSGLGWGAALYHLSVLERNRVLVAHAEGGFKRYFANGMQSPADMQRSTALRHATARRVLEAVQAEPGRSGRELAARLGLSPSTLARASDRLEAAGLLRRVRQGRRLRYYAEPAGAPVPARAEPAGTAPPPLPVQAAA